MSDKTPIALVRYVNAEVKAKRLAGYGRVKGSPSISVMLPDGQRVEATTEVTELEDGKWRRDYLYDGHAVHSVVTSQKPSEA